jgi:pimeloyl-ACP methyl ester carboxylesterase
MVHGNSGRSETEMQLERKDFQTRSSRISCLEAGPAASPPIVWLHGVCRRAMSFRPQLEHFARNWRVYATDARGHGDSARMPGKYRWADHADDLIQFMTEHVRTPAVLVGHSLGALQAIAAAAQVPELTCAVVLEDPPLYSGERSDFDFTAFAAMERAVSAGATAAQILAAWPRAPWMTDGFRTDHAESLTQLDPENLRVTIDRTATDGFDVDGYLAKVRCPTLLMRANGPNPVLRAIDQARATKLLANAQVTVFENCGHLIHAERPDEYALAIERFLAEVL